MSEREPTMNAAQWFYAALLSITASCAILFTALAIGGKHDRDIWIGLGCAIFASLNWLARFVRATEKRWSAGSPETPE